MPKTYSFQAKRLKSLYQEAPLYHFSSCSKNQKIENQRSVLYQSLNKIFKGNPIYRGLSEEAIYHLLLPSIALTDAAFAFKRNTLLDQTKLKLETLI